MLREDRAGKVVIHVWTDASGSYGCGALVPHSGDWLQLQWPQSYARDGVRLREESITLKELLPIVIAGAIWGERWRRSAHVVMHCDNMGAVALVNSGYSRVPEMMHLLRCLFFIRAHFQFSVHAVHVPGVENTLADAISRGNLALLFAQVPRAIHSQWGISPNLVSLLAEQQPDWTSPTWRELFSSCFPPA